MRRSGCGEDKEAAVEGSGWVDLVDSADQTSSNDPSLVDFSTESNVMIWYLSCHLWPASRVQTGPQKL